MKPNRRFTKNVTGTIVTLNIDRGFGFFKPDMKHLIFRNIHFLLDDVKRPHHIDKLDIGVRVRAKEVWLNIKGYDGTDILVVE